jgi:hypothetical protein
MGPVKPIPCVLSEFAADFSGLDTPSGDPGTSSVRVTGSSFGWRPGAQPCSGAGKGFACKVPQGILPADASIVVPKFATIPISAFKANFGTDTILESVNC